MKASGVWGHRVEEEEERLASTIGNEMNLKKKKKKSVNPKLRTGTGPGDKYEDKIDTLGRTAKYFRSLKFTPANLHPQIPHTNSVETQSLQDTVKSN